jgi:pimeloyl-ACP methyl ester carboxylesterase
MPQRDDVDVTGTRQSDDLERTISIRVQDATLDGTLGVPRNASGIVLFAHGSGSSRFSPRNRFVARVLRDAGLGTLLLDLLSSSEEEIDETTREYRFDIGMLADRLVAAIDWLGQQPNTAALSVGLFGASTGAGAALVAAAERPSRVAAVVSRGGRPDLAGASLARRCRRLSLSSSCRAPRTSSTSLARCTTSPTAHKSGSSSTSAGSRGRSARNRDQPAEPATTSPEP